MPRDRISTIRLGSSRYAVVLDGEPFGPVVPEDVASVVAAWLRAGGLEYLESPRGYRIPMLSETRVVMGAPMKLSWPGRRQVLASSRSALKVPGKDGEP